MSEVPAISRFQHSTKQVVARADMLFHPDNPRFIDRHARKKLRESVKKGYVGGIVWNKRTRHLIGGNQRVSIIDELHGNTDYSLEIDVVDIPLEEEGAWLVRLNNEGAMGQWDLPKLEPILERFRKTKDGATSFPDLGFDLLDAQDMFPDKNWSVFASDKERPDVKADAAVLAEMGELRKNEEKDHSSGDGPSEQEEESDTGDINEHTSPEASSVDRMRSEKHRHKREGAGTSDDDAGFLLKVMFANESQAEAFCKKIGVRVSDGFVAGEELADLLEEDDDTPAST